MHLKDSVMMGHKPSSNENVFTYIFNRLGSLCRHYVSKPDVYMIEMLPFFSHKESYIVTTPHSDSTVAVGETKQYGKKVAKV